MDQCIVCYDDMDMKSFKDIAESTLTCTKLECGHAYHTKCIINCLKNSKTECPLCNKPKEEPVTMEGRRIQVVREMNRNQAVKDSRLEFKEAWKEYNSIFDILKKETTEFVRKRSEELRFREHRNYLQRSMESVKRSIRDFAKEKGPEYIGAFREVNINNNNYYQRRWYNQHVFGLTSWRNSNRITYPTLRIGLYNLKEE
jgi:hypothetical protein